MLLYMFVDKHDFPTELNEWLNTGQQSLWKKGEKFLKKLCYCVRGRV